MKTLRIFFLSVFSWLQNKFGIWHRPTRYDQIFQAIAQLQATRIMEIGTWNGKRAVQMIEQAKKFHSPETIEYFGFDLFETMDAAQFADEISKQPPTIGQVRERLSATGARVNLYKGDTTKTLPEMVRTFPPMDVVFIDGGHSYNTILSDWQNAANVMGPRTRVIFDDYWLNRKDGAAPIVDAINKEEYHVELLPAIDVFFNPNFGRLVIQLAQVTKRSPHQEA